MSTQVKLQVPIDRSVRDKLQIRATKLGFDSIQAYIRFWAKAETDGRTVNFEYDSWGEPSDAAAKKLNHRAKEAKEGKNVSKSFHTAEEALKHLHSL